MGYQKEPFESKRNNKDPASIVGKQRHVNQPGLAGDSGGGSAVALVHLPRYA